VNTMKYPIKEVNIKGISGNRLLEMGISRNQKMLCKKSIKQYGLVMPIVTVEDSSGKFVVLKGENELSVLKEMNVEKADVFITSIKNTSDISKVILLLSSFQRELNHISEGLLLRELLKSGEYNQKQLARQLMKSTSWISKRLSLAEKLNENVTTMVLSKEICPATAQNIARIPKQHQHTFAMKIYSDNIPKSIVEKLVTAYNNKNTSDTLKEEIINNPLLAADKINTVGIKKTDTKVDDNIKFEGVLRLMLRLVSELEAFFASWEKERLLKYFNLICVLETSLSRFLNLIRHEAVSPGKSNEYFDRTGGEPIGN
jgi:ParB/RepB/Spo0J family partition protein